MSEKTCSRCGLTKLLAAFKFEPSVQRYRTVCRECRNEAARRRYSTDEVARTKAQERAAEQQQRIKSTPELLLAAREQRREYKRLGRICVAPGYKAVRHDAHVECWRKWFMEQQAGLQLHDAHVRQPRAIALHDAHVRLAKADDTRWWHIHTKRQPSVAAARQRRRQQARETLADSYLTLLLTNGRTSCPISAGIPQSLIELKRAHLRLVRHLNQQEGETQ